MRRALITGITGQDGPCLAEHLLDLGYEVFGLVRGQNNARRPAVADAVPELRFVEGDLLDASSLIRAIDTAAPDEIYHLASTRCCGDAGSELIGAVTALGTERLLEAARFVIGASASRAAAPDLRVVNASSYEIFGDATTAGESTPIAPMTAQGIAKAYGHQTVARYRETYGMFACNGILFPHESQSGERHTPARAISLAAARVRAGTQADLRIRDLSVSREWGSAADHVRAMHLMLQQPGAQDVVIATGETRTVREAVYLALIQVGLDPSAYVVVDDGGLAAEASPAGDASQAGRLLGWRPGTSWSDLIAGMVESELGETARPQRRPGRRAAAAVRAADADSTPELRAA